MLDIPSITQTLPTRIIQSAPIINTPQPTEMSTTVMMLICGLDKAPKFDGTAENLLTFIKDYELCTDDMGLLAGDCIKGIICYLCHILRSGPRPIMQSSPDFRIQPASIFHVFSLLYVPSQLAPVSGHPVIPITDCT